MISVRVAQTKVIQNTPEPKTETVLLEKSLGRILAQAVKASLNLPVAENSAMDGFVLRSEDVAGATSKNPAVLKVKGVIKAGDKKRHVLKKSQAFSIMTGAFIPKGGDSILIKEQSEVRDSKLFVREVIPKGKHIRFCGEEIKKGQVVIPKSTWIYPSTIGLLATLGKRKMPVYKLPRVRVIATGSELVEPGKKLGHGKIYESNSWMLRAALEEMGIPAQEVTKIQDSPKKIRQKIGEGLRKSDVLILSGGVSVGDYDYVKEILRELGVKTVFWKVRQKPGKPLYFGKKGQRLIFGLPGNPASVLTCFYEYVYPALRKLAGFQEVFLKREKVFLQEKIKTDPKRTLFLKAKVFQHGEKKSVRVLRKQGSHMLSSFLEANALVVMNPEEKNTLKQNQVFIDKLPNRVP